MAQSEGEVDVAGRLAEILRPQSVLPRKAQPERKRKQRRCDGCEKAYNVSYLSAPRYRPLDYQIIKALVWESYQIGASNWSARLPTLVARENKPATVTYCPLCAGALLTREVRTRIRRAVRELRPKMRELQRARAREWMAMATPKWADLEKIAAIYDESRRVSCDSGVPHEVDHIIPLRGHDVCGLHVETNLRVITAEENRRKNNKWSVD